MGDNYTIPSPIDGTAYSVEVTATKDVCQSAVIANYSQTYAGKSATLQVTNYSACQQVGTQSLDEFSNSPQEHCIGMLPLLPTPAISTPSDFNQNVIQNKSYWVSTSGIR